MRRALGAAHALRRGAVRHAPAALVALGLLAAHGDAAVQRDCRSGATVYEHDGVRIFKDGRGGSAAWFACGPRSARPTPLWEDASVEGALGVFGRDGDRVLLEGNFYGEGGGERTVVGFFDAQTSAAHLGQLQTTLDNTVHAIAVAPDGGVGFVAGPGPRVGYLAPGAWRERALATVGAGYVEGSLAFAGGTLNRRTAGGGQRSVPLAGETVTCASGTTLIEHDGARVFEVLPDRRTDLGFQAAVLAACPRGAGTPRELAVADLERHWALREAETAGAHAAFLAGRNGVGVLTGGDVRFVAPRALRSVQELALDAAGRVAFAADGMIARMHAVLGWERSAAGPVASGSLQLAGDRLTWSRAGRPRSATLPAEPKIGCASGTTRLRRRGLRVFELARRDTALLACPPGARTPIALLTPKGKQRWRVTELAREHRRLAILARTRGAEAHDVISFDARNARAGRRPRRLAHPRREAQVPQYVTNGPKLGGAGSA